jgi:surface carbohydrate biosynthesis protein (TIGR04326 family)
LKENTRLLIWDLDKDPETIDTNCDVIFWNKKDLTSLNISAVSILDLIELKPKEYRSKYLSWLAKKSNQIVDGVKISDHFILNDNFNYWWLTSLMQKCNIETNSKINDAIKAIAFEDFISKKKYVDIELFSKNDLIKEVIEKYCKKNNLIFISHCLKNNYSFNSNNFKLFYNILKAFIFLFYYFFRNIFNNKKIKHHNHEVTFIDIFVHLKSNAIATGIFNSNYWTTLIDKLKEWNIGTNWIHIYTPSPNFKKIKIAEKLNNKFNINAQQDQFHYLLNQSLGFKIFYKIIVSYLRLIIRSNKIYKYLNVSQDDSLLDLWVFHKSDWITSISGPIAIESILRYELFDNYFHNTNYQKIGFYIMENQPWEFILNYTWKKNNHGKLIGVAHSTIRFWDLRYYFDKSVYDNFNNNLFLPTFIAVNGQVAYNNLIEAQVPSRLIIKLEALRYLYLLNFETKESSKIYIPKKELTVLVCGDFSEKITDNMFSIILNANKRLKIKINYIFKPHPAFGYNLSKHDLSGLNFKVSNLQIFELITSSDIVISSVMSSASVDAYILEKKIIQIEPGTNLNFSPLYNIPDIKVTSNSDDLYNEISSFSSLKVKSIPYFIINNDLCLWKKTITE